MQVATILGDNKNVQRGLSSVALSLATHSEKVDLFRLKRRTVLKRSNATVMHWFSMHRVAILLLRSLFLARIRRR